MLLQDNVLVSDDGHALITDFGLSSIEVTSQLEGVIQKGGTPRWMAPELVTAEQVLQATKSCDIWSFACLCYEVREFNLAPCSHFDNSPQILARKKPFHQYTTDAGLIFAMLRREIPLRPVLSEGRGCEEINDQMWNWLVTCWNYFPEGRPTCEDLQISIKTVGTWDDGREATREDEARTALEFHRETSYTEVDYARVENILVQVSTNLSVSPP